MKILTCVPILALLLASCLEAANPANIGSVDGGLGADLHSSPDASVDVPPSDTPPPPLDIGPLECGSDDYCMTVFPVGQCEVARCIDGSCLATPGPDGAACDDDNSCTTSDVCEAGMCAGVLVVCDDDNPCTTETCDPMEGCVQTPVPDGTACDDNDLCTNNEACLDGECFGNEGVDCGAPPPCFDALCVPETGNCQLFPHPPGSTCNDGDACTVDDVCLDQGCLGVLKDCDDADPCTTDACTDSGECAHVFDPSVCDDGDPCTEDSCNPWGCEYALIEDCCGDSDDCYDGDKCTADVCDPDTLTCAFPDNGSCCFDDQDCAADEICVGQTCFPAGNPDEYGFPRPATYVTALAIGGIEGEPPCCFDLDGDGDIDNALGELVGGIVPLIGNYSVNEQMQASVESGETRLLLAYGDLDGPPNDASLTVDGFIPEPNGASFAVNALGLGEFVAAESNWVPGTKTPRASFGDGSIASSLLEAGPGTFWSVSIAAFFPLLPAGMPMEQALTEATVSVGPNGSGLNAADGKIGGVVDYADMLAGLAAWVDDNCSCLNLSGPLMYATSENTAACSSSSSVTCGPMESEMCVQLHDFCNIFMLLVSPDIDTNANGVPDGMSLGLRFEGVSATLIDNVP